VGRYREASLVILGRIAEDSRAYLNRLVLGCLRSFCHHSSNSDPLFYWRLSSTTRRAVVYATMNI